MICVLAAGSAQNYASGEVGVSQLIDTWIVVRELEEDAGQRPLQMTSVQDNEVIQALPACGADQTLRVR
jgi:hypothetical protein